MLHVLQRGLWPTHWDLFPHGLILVGVGIVVAVLVAVLGSPGDVELMVDNIHVVGGHDNVKMLRSLIPVSLLCVSAGGALGPEAPLIQTTGTFASVLGTRLQLERNELRAITITGMASGFTVLFGAPLGAAVFALEILHRRGLEYYEALLPAVIGSLWGYVVYVIATGAGLEPVWSFPSALPMHAGDLGWAVACGVVGAIVAVLFTYTALGLRAAVKAVPIGARPALGGLVLALLAWVSPYALTFGEAQIGDITTTSLAIHVLLLGAAAKLVASAVTLATGWRGGFIIPLFFIGSALGLAAHSWLPGTNEWVLVTALMVACNVGVTKTPIGSVLVVTEMAGVTLLPTTIVASVVALLLTSNVGLIESQRRRERVA
ncbi:MAG TPA: chloride channel protein [Acidimicrobiales bacterium]|nr:chloride channel protein [Acidimicrobiales bacterium]